MSEQYPEHIISWRKEKYKYFWLKISISSETICISFILLFQALIYFYYFSPFYVAAICSLLYPNQHWMRDWSIIHAGASSQAQLVYIICSFHWDTKVTVPDNTFAHAVFLTINVSLWIVPHLFAVYCNWDGLTVFWEDEVVPRLKSLKGRETLVDLSDGEVSPSKIPRRQGPVTRGKRKKQN